MKCLVVYSSLTGNTKMVAEAIFEIMPEGTDMYPVERAPSSEDYDLIALGFWADRENADKRAQGYISKIKDKQVALFMTLGAYPDSQHAINTMENAKALVAENNNKVVGEFMCQGKVDPKLIERFSKLPADNPHGMTPERRARLEEAAKHPNIEDLQNAKNTFKSILEKL